MDLILLNIKGELDNGEKSLLDLQYKNMAKSIIPNTLQNFKEQIFLMSLILKDNFACKVGK